MKITLESTSKIVQVRDGANLMTARVWEGKTAAGVFVQALIVRVAAPDDVNLEDFERELIEHRAPTVDTVFPTRLVL